MAREPPSPQTSEARRRPEAASQSGIDEARGPHRWDSVSYPDTHGWKIDPTTKRLRIQGIGHIKVRLHKDLPGRPKTITVKRRGKCWELTVICDRVPAKVLPATGKQVGIDLGVASILTTSDGDHLANPRFTRKAEEKLGQAQRERDRKVKGSKRRAKASRRSGRCSTTAIGAPRTDCQLQGCARTLAPG